VRNRSHLLVKFSAVESSGRAFRAPVLLVKPRLEFDDQAIGSARSGADLSA
jgi:hypothetical protein